MLDSRNRIRQARRGVGLSQAALAERLGVHRSAVAQWEKAGGTHPTVENLARIALATQVSFEWLSTGRGRMQFRSDIAAQDPEETPALLLQLSAQSETEERALAAMRRLPYAILLPIVEMMEALARPAKLRFTRAVAYSR